MVVRDFVLWACGLPDFSSEYAIASVKLAGGQILYFKREVRGINGSYDVIAISANSDLLATPNFHTSSGSAITLLLASFVCHKCIVYLSQPLRDFPCSGIIPVGNVHSSCPVAFTALEHYRSYITV
jgi:hypothetical protein